MHPQYDALRRGHAHKPCPGGYPEDVPFLRAAPILALTQVEILFQAGGECCLLVEEPVYTEN